MGRGEEYVKRKHQRAERKRARSAGDGGEAELAAAKKRRRKGKRRITEGMCYSLPTVENPFLDEKERAFRMTHGKKVNPEAPKAKRAKALQAEQENTNAGLAPKPSEAKPAKTKKVFWPKGDQGKARITAVSDPRLPQVFRSAAESLSVNAPSGFQADVWQAALRGQGVLGFCGGVFGEGLHDPLVGYLLPAVQHMKAQEEGKKGQGPVVLVLVPNKERGAQVIKACQKIREGGLPLKAVNIHDGTSPHDQLEGLENQVVDLVAATPGRLSQLNIVKGDLLSRVTFAVLDSANKLSERDLRQVGLIADSLRPDAQTLLFTSGYDSAVHEITRKWLKDPVQRVAADKSPVALCAGIEQHFSVCAEDKKSQRVVKSVLDVREAEQDVRVKSRILIVAATPLSVTKVVEALAEAGLKAGARHDDMRTEERLSAEDDFRAGKVPIVVTTSLASPGLAASSVPVLIVHDLPATIPEYVGLVRQVARSTISGRVYNLITKEQAHLALGLLELLQSCAQPIDPKLEMMARAVKLVQQQLSGNGQVSITENGRSNGVNGIAGGLNGHLDGGDSASEGSGEGEEDQDKLRALKEERNLGTANGKWTGKGSKRSGVKEVMGEPLGVPKRKPSEGEILEGQGKGKRKKKDVVEESNKTMSRRGVVIATASEALGRGKRKWKAVLDVAGIPKSAAKTEETSGQGEVDSEDDYYSEDLEDDEGTLDEEERLQQAEGGSSKEELDRLQAEGAMSIEEILNQYRNQGQ